MRWRHLSLISREESQAWAEFPQCQVLNARSAPKQAFAAWICCIHLHTCLNKNSSWRQKGWWCVLQAPFNLTGLNNKLACLSHVLQTLVTLMAFPIASMQNAVSKFHFKREPNFKWIGYVFNWHEMWWVYTIVSPPQKKLNCHTNFDLSNYWCKVQSSWSLAWIDMIGLLDMLT